MKADRAIGALVWIALASSASAQEIGRIDALLDGRPLQWETRLDGPGGAPGSTGHSRFDALFAVSLQGYPSASADDAKPGILALQFAVPRGLVVAADPVIAYFPGGFGSAYVADIDSGAEIRLDRFDPGAGHAAGQFSARLCHRSSPMVRADPDRCMLVQGRFDSAVPLSD